MQLSQKQKKFLNLSLHFWNLAEIRKIKKKKKLTLIDFVHPKLQIPKT